MDHRDKCYLQLVRIHHLALRTRNLERLERFYVDVLGLKVTKHDASRAAWLDAEGTFVVLEEASEAEPEVAASGRDFVAFAIPVKKRAEYKERLQARGVTIEEESAYTIYIRDPDGRRIGLSHYPFEVGGVSWPPPPL
jgi:catechol 2,3-dioxygenase-like lactoylglutathione lyase family enzyme